MSTIELVFLFSAVAATALFVVGYARGAKTAMATYDTAGMEIDEHGDVQSFGWQIAAAVVAASAIIGLVGVFPAFIYVGPALAIVTAAVNGIAFFMERTSVKALD
ncbi:MAG: hypothetical protein ABJ215_05575 [Alphaproteobacteria bacterium]